MKSIAVDPTNADALRNWDGGDGAYWTDNETLFDLAVARYDAKLHDAARIAATDRVLDIGCGSGHTTREAARRAVDGEAVGVDLSSQLIERARKRAAEQGLDNVHFVQADAQIHAFEAASFDVAISRTGTMFFGDPVAAFTNIRRALRPGGRLVLLVWRSIERNEWFASFTGALAAGRTLPVPPPDAPTPFSLADPNRVRSILGAAGFVDVELDALAEPMYFGRDVDEAHALVLGLLGFLLEGLDESGRRRALDDLRATIAAHATRDGVLYPSATWLVTATCEEGDRHIHKTFRA
jgi:SAM-dependent methyltransferase